MDYSLKELTVAEAAIILIEQGIIRRDRLVNKNRNGNSKTSTGEPQVRLWIREYNKVYQEEYKKGILEGGNDESSSNFAHTKAARSGIRATIQSKKSGYRIKEEDLKEFIRIRIGDKKETNIIDGLLKLMEGRQEEIQKTKGKLESEWFTTGFQEAIDYLKLNLPLRKEFLSKTVVRLPHDGWYTDELGIIATEFKLYETDKVMQLMVEFLNRNIEQLQFKLKIIIEKGDGSTESKIDWALQNAVLANHYRLELEKLVSDMWNTERIKGIIAKQIPEENEKKLAILWMLAK